MSEHEPIASRAEIHEPVEPAAPTEPVSRGLPSSAAGRSRWRWLVALLVVALAVTATVAGGVLLTGARSASTVARWAPTDSLVYVELRPDLPGDQRDQLAAFLSAFPGFADRSTLDQKLTEVYDRLVSAASKGKQSYGADVAPWFGGQLGAAIRPPAVPSQPASGDRTPPPSLLVASSTDPTKALAWFRSSMAAAGAQIMPTNVGGATLLVASVSGRTIAAAAPSDVLLVGDEASVRAALARGGSNGLATDAGFQAAMAALPADGLATAYIHVAAYADLLARVAGGSAGSGLTPDLGSLLPAWAAATLRAGSDALTIDGAAPATKATTAVPDGPTALPGRLPSSTIALDEVKDVGAAVTAAVSLLGPSQRSQLDGALSRAGGLDALTGWAGEGGVAVVRTATGPLPGVVALATDAKAAAAFDASLSNIATLAGLKPSETTYAGHTITTIRVEMPVGGGCVPGSTCSAPPPGGSGASSSTVQREISWAATGDLFVAGAGPAFVQAVLDTKPGATLADSSRFTSMAGRVASSNHAFAWLDVAALRGLMVAKMPAAEKSRYEADIAPYLAPLDGAVAAATHDGSLERAQGLLILTRP